MGRVLRRFLKTLVRGLTARGKSLRSDAPAPKEVSSISSVGSGLYRFGPFRLDKKGRVLLRDNREIPLTPKVFDLLLLLVEKRGVVQSKESLLDALWPDTAVEEANLTQSIFVLRKALGDDSSNPAFIRTLPRRGYCFIAPLDPAEPAENGQARTGNRQPRRPLSGSWFPAPGRKWLRGLSLPWSFTLAALILAGFALFLVRPGRSDRESTSLFQADADSAGIRLALMPIETDADDGRMRMLAFTLTDLLSHRLQTMPHLFLVGLQTAGEKGNRDILQKALGKEIRFILGGRLRESEDGKKGHLSIVLQNLRPNGSIRKVPVGQFDIPFILEQEDVALFTRVRDQIVRQALKDLLPAIHLSPDGSISPHDPEAYHLYLTAVNQLRKAACVGEQALTLLQTSLEKDRKFAPAWEAAGWAHYNMVTFCGQPGKHYERALEAVDRALALQPNWTRAVALKVTILVETGRTEEAYQLARDSARRRDWDPYLKYLQSYALRYAGYLSESQQDLQMILTEYPIFLSLEGWSPNTLLYQRKNEAFLRYLPSTDAPLFHFYRALTKALSGDRSSALKTLARGNAGNPNDVFARLCDALSAILRGRDQEAGVILHQLTLQRARTGGADGEVTYKLAQLFALLGEKDSALGQLQLAIDQGFFCFPYLCRDSAFESLRSDPSFEKIRRHCQVRHEAFGRHFGLRPYVE